MQASKEALESELSLQLLSTIGDDQSITQCSLALDLGIAVGLANVYFKRCVRKSWAKAQAVPAKRYADYLTPKGLSEKSRLVGEYLTSSLRFFRNARAQCAECLADSHDRGWRSLALVGDGDLAEIAIPPPELLRLTSTPTFGFLQPGRRQRWRTAFVISHARTPRADVGIPIPGQLLYRAGE